MHAIHNKSFQRKCVRESPSWLSWAHVLLLKPPHCFWARFSHTLCHSIVSEVLYFIVTENRRKVQGILLVFQYLDKRHISRMARPCPLQTFFCASSSPCTMLRTHRAPIVIRGTGQPCTSATRAVCKTCALLWYKVKIILPGEYRSGSVRRLPRQHSQGENVLVAWRHPHVKVQQRREKEGTSRHFVTLIFHFQLVYLTVLFALLSRSVQRTTSLSLCFPTRKKICCAWTAFVTLLLKHGYTV